MGAAEIKKLVEEKKVAIGTGRTLKKLKQGKASCVYITKNAPERVRSAVAKYAALSGVQVLPLELSNDELGVICRKQFRISVLSVVQK